MPVLERETSLEQHAQELASQSLETHRIPDPYMFVLKSGELFSPTKHTKIKDEVKDQTSALGSLEFQAVVFIEEWADKNEEGVCAWISPSLKDVYPVLKIIVSEIVRENGVKGLFNRAILFDFDQSQSMKFAWNLTSFSKNRPVFTSLDEVRATPLILDTKDQSWIETLEWLIPDSKLWDSIRAEDDQRAKERALEQARGIQNRLFFSDNPIDRQKAQMEIRQMMGPHPGSCPPKTALQVFSENSSIHISSSILKDPDFCHKCPVCKAVIDCIVRQGQSCRNCGTVKRCG